MTDQEKKQQRVLLMVELEDAQLELAHLREKAIRMAEIFSGIEIKIRHNIGLQPSGHDFTLEGDIANRIGPFVQIPDFAELAKVIEELKVARQKIHNLNQRKSNLAGGLNIKFSE